MLRPTPGELIAGVRRELRDQVLPHVPSGEPARQLRAALHLFGRLERSWDLLPGYLQADNADLRHSLTALAELTNARWSERPTASGAEIPGVHDPTLNGLIEENTHLQAQLDHIQQEWRATGRVDPAVDELLLGLHSRMVARAEDAAGLQPEGR